MANTQEILKTQATGVAFAYQERKDPLGAVLKLDREIHETRAPGRYLAALELWSLTLHTQPLVSDVSWLKELKHREKQQAVNLLTASRITVDDIESLKKKLVEISPQLSKLEVAQLEILTTNGGLYQIGLARKQTVEGIFLKLEELGAKKEALRHLGFANLTM